MIIKLLKYLLYFSFFAFFLWLGSYYFSLGGNFVINDDFKNPRPLISDLYPKERVDFDVENKNWKIKSDLVYFDVRTPRIFETISLELTYKNSDHNFVSLGGRTAKTQWEYKIQPLEIKAVDSLNWSELSENGVYFLQQTNDFYSYSDFLEAFPDINGNLAIISFDNVDKKISEYPNKTKNIKTTSLESENVKYFAGYYTKPKINDNIIATKTTFNMKDLYIDQNNQNSMQFMISASDFAEDSSPIILTNIKIILQKESVTKNNITQRFDKLLKKIFYDQKI